MLGTPKRQLRQSSGDGTSLAVVEVFSSVQGSGPFAGVPAIIVRLAECALACYWCDVKFDASREVPTDRLVGMLLKLVEDGGERLIVITGGEPLLHPLGPLLHALNTEGLSFQVETSGAVRNDEALECINMSSPLSMQLYSGSLLLSPKGPHIVQSVAHKSSAYLYVVREGELDDDDGLPNFSTQSRGRFQPLARPPLGYPSRSVYLQPCSEGDTERDRMNLRAAWISCKKYGYRLAIRQQKLLGLR